MRYATVIKALLAKGAVLFVRISPCRRCAIEILARFVGLAILLNPRNRIWAQTQEFARLTNAEPSGWRYFIRYCVEQGRLLIWTIVFYEIPDHLDKYIEVVGSSELQQAAADGPGAIMVGAHYGPRLATFLLRRQGISARPVAAKKVVAKLTQRHPASRLAKSRRREFLSHELQPLEARRTERELLNYAKNGNVVIMMIDLPMKGTGGTPVSLFGRTVELHYFPFKLGRRHHMPVFYYFFLYKPGRGYQLRITRSPAFSTHAQGVADYARELEKQVLNYPFSWAGLREFVDFRIAQADETCTKVQAPTP